MPSRGLRGPLRDFEVYKHRSKGINCPCISTNIFHYMKVLFTHHIKGGHFSPQQDSEDCVIIFGRSIPHKSFLRRPMKTFIEATWCAVCSTWSTVSWSSPSTLMILILKNSLPCLIGIWVNLQLHRSETLGLNVFCSDAQILVRGTSKNSFNKINTIQAPCFYFPLYIFIILVQFPVNQ